MQEGKRRYVGIDLGKRTYALAVIGKKGKVVFSNGKTNSEGRVALYRKLDASDKVAIEAGNLAFIMAKEIIDQVGCEVVVLNAGKLALIHESMKKTDKEDALKLARIIEQFRDDQLPSVPMPSDKEMRRRKLIHSHKRAVKQVVQMINLLHGLFVHQGITTVVKKDLSRKERRDEAVKQLSGLEAQEAAWAVKILELSKARIEELEELMAEEREGDADIERLMGVPGVGPMVSLAYLAYVGDGSRFENAAQVSNYFGLVPRVDISCTIVRYGGITKKGNTYLRSLLVQAAWALTRSKDGGALKERYEYMTKTKGLCKKKAIIAIARRLSELLWTLLRQGTEYETRRFAGGQGPKASATLAKEALAS
jgi:transposase